MTYLPGEARGDTGRARANVADRTSVPCSVSYAPGAIVLELRNEKHEENTRADVSRSIAPIRSVGRTPDLISEKLGRLIFLFSIICITRHTI